MITRRSDAYPATAPWPEGADVEHREYHNSLEIQRKSTVSYRSRGVEDPPMERRNTSSGREDRGTANGAGGLAFSRWIARLYKKAAWRSIMVDSSPNSPFLCGDGVSHDNDSGTTRGQQGQTRLARSLPVPRLCLRATVHLCLGKSTLPVVEKWGQTR